jgi:hypothetical protein
MEATAKILLWVHVITGNLALWSGLMVIFLEKGNKRHQKIGKFYFSSILVMGICALLLSWFRSNNFLFHIGLFVLYQAISGKNTLRVPSKLGFLVLGILAGINGAIMVGTLNKVLMVFGAISLVLVIGDFRLLFKWGCIEKVPYVIKLKRHIGMMMGSFIGTVTAFIVVNNQSQDYGLWLWLGPTAILVPLLTYWQFKFPKKMGLSVFILGLICISEKGNAQVYVDGGHTRHRFAQLNLGVSFHHHTGRTPEEAFGKIYEQDALNEMRLVIGGTHFWGHADFFIAIPTVGWGTKHFSSKTETGMRLYPWRIQKQRVRPFIGASWRPSSIQYGAGAKVYRHQTPLTLGVTYLRNDLLMTAGFGVLKSEKSNYYFSRNQIKAVSFPAFYGFVSLKYMLETSLSAEREWISGKTKWKTDTLAKLGRLDGITMAVGISSGMFQGSGAYNAAFAPYLGKHHLTNVFADLGLGYYFFKPDIQINLAYRQNSSAISGHGAKQTFSRQALTLESYKFIFDYHGFVPFVGPALSYEWLGVQENFNLESAYSNSGLFPGITFGWDIRPNDLQSWYLRTNLRWFPTLHVQGEGARKHRVPLLEFNFIQLVIFPGRILGY